jgi:nucleoside-diphosphate-sugar epimerase
MIIGSGMMASAFAGAFAQRNGVVVYAAGVSNSQCRDVREYERERVRLAGTLATHEGARSFVYFSTCSVEDPESQQSDYVRHKLAMERLVAAHPGHLVLRLPQVAGRTPNPHTLLNYLHARIIRGERFVVWANAYRNIIDSSDVARIGGAMVDHGVRARTMNVANVTSHPLPEIVRTIEKVTGTTATFDLVPRGSQYAIDVAEMESLLPGVAAGFDKGYLERVIAKYYG